MQFCQYVACIDKSRLACLGRSCIATINALAYEEGAYPQYFSHLSSSLPRFDRPESLPHGLEIRAAQ